MQNSKKVILFLGDLIAIFGAFFVSLRLGYFNNFSVDIYKTHIGPFLIIYAIWIVLLFAFGMYEPENLRPTIKSIKNLFVSLLISLLISVSFFYIFNIFGISPKTNLIINMAFFILFYIAERRIITSLFHKHFVAKILLVGSNKELDELAQEIQERKSVYYEITKHSPSLEDETINNINEKHFDIVIISRDEIGKDLISQNLERILNSGSKFMDLTEAYEKLLGKIPSNQIDNLWFITKVDTIKNKIYDSIKRFIEIILGISLFIILSPILFIIYIIIKIDDGGPFVYSQIRIGKAGKPFRIYKIRSMIQDSEKNGAEWAKEKDSRVTKIGNFLRKSHLDESLQLINIIQGNISLVGPRPERPEFTKDLAIHINNYNLRHIVKPGITGWAQINYKYGNSIEDSRKKFEYDLYYVKNRNIFMDLGIVLRTIKTIFF